MDKHTEIQCSKDILGGTPVFRGTRVPVATFIDYLEGGDPLDVFLNDFPTVTRGQALQVLELAKPVFISRSDCGIGWGYESLC